MRKIVTVALYLSFLTSVTSCKKEIQSNDTLPKVNVAKKDSLTASITTIASKTEQLTKEIISETKITKEKLTKTNAVSVYKTFREKIENLVGELNEENSRLVDDYYKYYDQDSNKMIYPDSIQIKIKHFDAARLEMWDIGEGMSEIRTKPDFYTSIFNNYLPKDYSVYLQLEAFDNTKLYAADAGFSITLTEVSQRVLNWENFLVKFPNSPLYKETKEIYKSYLRDYLYGLDNTSTFEYADMTLYPESKEEFDRFINKNPNKVTAKILKTLLASLENKVTMDELHEVIEKEQAKYAITL
jgi:hypothetical protein